MSSLSSSTFLTKEVTRNLNDLSKQVQLAIDKIEINRNEALDKAKEIRRQKMQDIEKHFMSQCNTIQERYNQLMRLEEHVRKRLTLEACQIYINTNSEDTDEAIIIQEMIKSISEEIWQLRWNASSKLLKASTHDIEKHVGFSPLFENAATDTLKKKDEWVGGWAKETALAHRIQQSKPKKPTKPQKIDSCQKLISLFSSNATEEDVKNYLKTFFTLTKKKSINPQQIAILILSFLRSIDEYESQIVTSKYIDIIKSCTKKHFDGEFMVIVGIQVFLSSQGRVLVDQNTVNTFSHLCLFFTQNQCITNETILKWYQKGTHGRIYVGYPLVRGMASKYVSQTFGI